MKRFSSAADRRHIFDPLRDIDRESKIQEQEGDWINLYELLGVSPEATRFEINEAIIERGADAVFFAFSGNAKPPHILQLEKHLPEMRFILLDVAVRSSYDDQLTLHKNKDSHAQKYVDFVCALDRREYSGCMAALIPFAIFLSARGLGLLAA